MTRITRIFLCLMACSVLSLSMAGGAAAASSNAAIKDCNDGSLDGDYSSRTLKRALSDLPSDIDQYSDCRVLLQQALLKSIGGKGGRKGGPKAGIGEVTTPAERRKIEKDVAAEIKDRADNPIGQIDGATIERGSGHTLASSAGPTIPAPLVAALIGILLLFIAEAAGRARGNPLIQKLNPGNSSTRHNHP